MHNLTNDSLHVFHSQEKGEIKADLASCSVPRSVDDMHYEMLNIVNET